TVGQGFGKPLLHRLHVIQGLILIYSYHGIPERGNITYGVGRRTNNDVHETGRFLPIGGKQLRHYAFAEPKMAGIRHYSDHGLPSTIIHDSPANGILAREQCAGKTMVEYHPRQRSRTVMLVETAA